VTSSASGDPRLRELGQYIRLQRQLADLSLRRMSELTSVSNAYLSQVERGLHQPSLRVLRSIAEALNVSTDSLLAQAGLLGREARDVDEPPASGSPKPDTPPRTTEEAIQADPNLTAEERDALLAVYRGFRARHPSA
jgi:transcriptional regulator with XRE-family HTH domain